mmetsp:Transcript_42328/g.109150  ORF Transcript_42328/g.109150 Transcript_42328/m.109150 type:complete len:312 (+) Transcript_42328:798-1733(+)
MVKDLCSIEAAESVDASIQVSRGAISARHVETGTSHPTSAEAIKALGLAECLVLEVLAAKEVKPGEENLGTKVRPLGGHRLAGAPALVLNIQHLAGAQVIRTIMATNCVDQRERVEAHAQELGLLAQRLTLGGIARGGRRGRLPEEVEDGPEETRVAVQEDATIAVSGSLCTARQKALQEAARLLHYGVAGGLEDDATDVDVDHGLRRNVVFRDAMPLLLVILVLHPELLALQHEPPALRGHVPVHVVLLLAEAEAGVLAFLLDLAAGIGHLEFRSLPVVANAVVLCLLLRHKLLPHPDFLVLEGLALTPK